MREVILEIFPVSHDTATAPRTTVITISCGPKSAQVHLAHPFTPEQDCQLKWYLQDYPVKAPFEVTKAEGVAASLATYGRGLARQIWNAGIVPGRCKLSIHVLMSPDAHSPPSDALQALHWEVIEDIVLWPANSCLKQVVVKRVLPPSNGTATRESFPNNTSTVLNVLMVVARPNHDEDINHRLISLPFMEAISKRPKTQGDLVANPFFVRPATWEMFIQQLGDQEDGFY
jgi:hypothetical protein